jgi:hypothetical protein
MRLFNVNKIFYLKNPNSSSFGDFLFIYWFKCNQSCSQDIVHIQFEKSLNLKFKKKREKRQD